MSIYSPQHKAIYLSPNRLDILHRRRGLSAPTVMPKSRVRGVVEVRLFTPSAL